MEQTIEQLEWRMMYAKGVLLGLREYVKEHPESADSFKEVIEYEEERLRAVEEQIYEKLYR